MKKKLLFITLIFTLVLNQFSINALSENSVDDENLEYAVKLRKIGVFVGSEDGFELDRPATRLEGIIMLIRLLGNEEEAIDTYYDIPFTDVPSWATNYVSYAYNYGLSNGVSDTEFGSMDPLTNKQYFTFMARVLGYDDSDGDFVWTKSIEFMKELDFISAEEQAMYDGKALLRSDVAKLSYKLMTQPVKNSPLLLVNQLLQSGDIDPDIATEIGIYTPIETDRVDSSLVTLNKLTARYDTLNIDRSVEQGYPSPFEVPATTNATSIPSNVITFTNGLTGQALFKSLSHKGFSHVSALYNTTDITWHKFIGSIKITDSHYTLTTMLKNNDFYEHKFVDQFEQFYTYYKEDNNIYYEVNEVYTGDYDDPIKDLTKEVYGTMAYMQAFKANDYPTYNPLLLTEGESLLYITFTTLDNETLLYLEKKINSSFVQQWISLKEGLVVKEYIFGADGLIKSIKNNTTITHDIIADSVFDQPDIEYFDLTLLLYALTYDNLESLQLGLSGTFSEKPFSFDLLANGKVAYRVHVNGYDGGDAFNKFAYISQGIDSSKTTIELRQFYDGDLFHSIVPSMKTDEVVEDSIERIMMFNLDELSFRNFRSKGNIDIYTFENTKYAGLSGLPQYFDYSVNTSTHKVESISKYLKESAKDSEHMHEIVYTFNNFGIYDSSVFKVPADYTVLTRPNEVYYDGEFPHAWYYFNELNGK